MADQCKSKSGCEARLHFSKGFRCAFVLWTVPAKKLNLSKLPASKIFSGCVHTDKGLQMPRETCHGKLVKENPLTHSHGQVRLVEAKPAKKTC